MANALSYIAAGTPIQFSVSGAADGFDDDDAQNAVRTELSKYFTVQRVYLDAPALGGIYSGWPFTADIVVQTKEAYGDVTGPASIVAHAVYEATGYMPSVSAPAFGGPSNSDPSIVNGSGIGDLLSNTADSISKSIGDALRNIIKPTAEGAVDVIMPLVIVVAVIAIVLVVNVGGKTTRVGI
jgi:hypothetical protein